MLKLYISQHHIRLHLVNKNTFSVFPGEIVNLDKYGKLEKRYNFSAFDNSMVEYNYTEYDRREIKNSVKEQLISDVPLGAFYLVVLIHLW